MLLSLASHHTFLPRARAGYNPSTSFQGIQERKGPSIFILELISSLLINMTDKKPLCAGNVMYLVVEQIRAKTFVLGRNMMSREADRNIATRYDNSLF